jgi:hypothetical protein
MAQAAGLMATEGLTAWEYLDALAVHSAAITDEGRTASYPMTLAGAVRLSTTRLAADNPFAAELLAVCAMLAPDPIPMSVLSHIGGDGPVLRRTLARIAQLGLARVGRGEVQLHRLIQAIIVDQLTDAKRADVRVTAERAMAAADPGDTEDPATRADWRRYIPHLIALDPASSDDSDLRAVASRAVRHLLVHGEHQIGRDLATANYRGWLARLGPDHPNTLNAATRLAMAWRIFGDYDGSRKLREDTLARQRRVLGADHPDTLLTAGHLADMMAEDDFEQAIALQADTLERQRRVLGEDHPETLLSKAMMASFLSRAGDLEQAVVVGRDAWERQRYNFGDDHPWTIVIALYLIEVLTAAGDLDDARLLVEPLIPAARRVLGDDSSEAHEGECALALIMFKQGHVDSAHRLAQTALARSVAKHGADNANTRDTAAWLAPILDATST